MKYSVEEEIDMLASAGLLTERQAEVYVLREIEATPGWAVAEELDLGESTVSDYLADARAKIDKAEATLDVIKEIRFQHE